MFRNLSIFLMMIIAQLSFALPEDTQKKLNIVSDTWTYNYKEGTSVFEGNVIVDQGTTHITADKLTTKNNAKHEIQEAIAYGKQHLVHYWTLPKIGDAELHAHAKIIRYYPIESHVTLEKEVVVTQKENSFRGDVIHYSMNDQNITVPPTKNGRAILIYNPDE